MTYNSFRQIGRIVTDPRYVLQLEPIPGVLDHPDEYGVHDVRDLGRQEAIQYLVTRNLGLGIQAAYDFVRRHNPTVRIIDTQKGEEAIVNYRHGEQMRQLLLFA